MATFAATDRLPTAAGAALTIAARQVQLRREMFALIRRFVIGWLLVRILRRLTRGSTSDPRR